jgi:N-acetylglutamate synthase-like GNAT family acetyltransferase
MYVIELPDKKRPVSIDTVVDSDYNLITKKKYAFNWKLEKEKTVYKLKIKGQPDILGLISIEYFTKEERIEIRLLAVSKENEGKGKTIDRIAGNLIAYAARLAIQAYGVNAAISLVPKTKLAQHYIKKYGFEPAGLSLFMDGKNLLALLKEYDYD